MFFPCCLGPFVRGWVSLYCNSVGCYFSATLQYNFLHIDKKKKISIAVLICEEVNYLLIHYKLALERSFLFLLVAVLLAMVQTVLELY